MTRFILTILILSAAFIFNVNAQYVTGFIDDEIQQRAYAKTPLINRGFNFAPEDDSFSLQKYCPSVKAQEGIKSCAGWAVGYEAQTITVAVKNNITDQTSIDEIAYSAMYPYIQAKDVEEGCGSGSNIDTVINLIMKKGNCFLKDFDTQDCDEKISDEIHQLAAAHKIKARGKLFEINAKAEDKIFSTIKSLSTKNPVIAGINVTPSFKKLLTELWTPLEPSEGNYEGHAVCIIAYDKKAKEFEIMNSWGTDWGKDGFCKVSFDDYARFVKYGYELIIDNPWANNIIELEGNFEFDKRTITGQFKTYNPTLADGVYIYNESQSTNDFFQLQTSLMPDGQFFYIFSLKPNKTIEIIYPDYFKQKNTDIAGISVKPMPVSPSIEATMRIPKNPENGLQTDQKGTDYLIVLFSNYEIEDLEKRTQNMAFSDYNNIIDKLRAAFGDRLMPDEDIEYQTNAMSLKAASNSGDIAPIILQVEVE